MYKYYLTSVFISLDDYDLEVYEPGHVVDGEIVSSMSIIPPRTSAVVFDRDSNPKKFVIKANKDWSPPSDWVELTVEEIQNSYPGSI